jgi:hypothetical protein
MIKEEKQGYYEYDLAVPEDAEQVFQTLGGEDLLRNDYPDLWELLQDSKTKALARAEHRSATGVDPVLFGYAFLDSLQFNGEYSNAGTIGSSLIGFFDDGSFIPAHAPSKSTTPLPRSWPWVEVSAGIYDGVDNRYVATLKETYEYVNKIEASLKSTKIYSKTELTSRRFLLYADFTGIDYNGELHVGHYGNFTILLGEGGMPVITRFEVTKPKSLVGRNPILVAYGRSDPKKVDICYPDNIVKNNCVRLLLPLGGSFYMSNNYSPRVYNQQASSFPILQFNGETPLEYHHDQSEIATFFSIPRSRDRVDFRYDDDWGVDINIQNFPTGYRVGATNATMYLASQFSFKLSAASGVGIVNDVSLTIRSVDSPPSGQQFYCTTGGGLTVFIPPINIFWGCFAAETLILMADRSQKPISEIVEGDCVATESGDAQVLSVVTGHEEQVIHIDTIEGTQLRVTGGHPLVLEDGSIIRAEALRPGFGLRSSDGSAQTVKWAYAEDYNSTVYNLNLGETGRTVIANGLLVGDIVMQNEAPETPSVQTPELTPRQGAAVQQLHSLMEKLRDPMG